MQLGLQVYPNPATNVVNVFSAEVVTGNANLYAMDGKLLKQQEIKFGSVIFDVSDLTPGIYLVQVYDENKTIHTAKIVVQH